MSTSQQLPDYALEDFLVVTDPRQVKAIFDPLRGTLLELLLERAASVQELAAAVGRPKSSTAYHVKLLADARLLRVVRTAMVRGKQERFYGRVARLFTVGDVRLDPPAESEGLFDVAARDAAAAVRDDDLRGTIRYAWIDRADAAEFWTRVLDLVNEYGRLPRTSNGTAAYGLLTAMYPTEHSRLGPRTQPSADQE